MSWGQTQKEICRRIATLNLADKPARHALFFPASEAKDVISAKQTGLITKDSHLTCVERKCNVFNNMRNVVGDLFDAHWSNHKLHCHWMNIDNSPFNLAYWVNRLPKLDFAFWDFCGVLTQGRWDAINKVECANSSTICFTFDIHGLVKNFVAHKYPYVSHKDTVEKMVTAKLHKWRDYLPSASSIQQTKAAIGLLKDWANVELEAAIEYKNRENKHPMLFLKFNCAN